MTYDVFISYARKDGLEFAERLERDLRAHGYSIWRDKRNLDVYQDFTAEIEIGIRESRFVVVCVSPSIEQNAASFVRREISYARSKNKPIIPLVLPNADLPLDIINLTWIGCFAGSKPAQTLAYEQGFTNLLTRLTRNEEPGSRPATSSDPYREYVEGLYEGIVNLLDQTMIKLIDVRSEATPTAVQGAPKKHNPLAAFKGRYGMKADAIEAPVTSFRDAYERYQGRVLLLGEPGAGKSTTLLSFARDAAAARLSDPTQPLPLLARCAMWDSTTKTPIIEWIAQSADIPVTDLMPLINAGKTILLLDALDELGHERIERKKGPDGKDVDERYDPRKRFLPLLPVDIPVVLSCRIKDYAELGETLPLNGAVTLQPLTDDQIQHYLSDVTGLWDVVESDPALLDIARTPLLLSIIAFAFRDAPQELKPRADLSEVGLRNFIFDRYVRERYAYEQNRNDEALPFTLEEVQEVLGHVAMINASGGFRGYLEGGTDVVENVLERRDFAQKLSDENIDSFLDFILLLDLILHAEDGTTRFIHLKLRDTFAYDYSLSHLYEESLYEQHWYFSPAKALGQVADATAILILSKLLHDRQAVHVMRKSAADGLGKTSSDMGRDRLLTVLHDKTDNDQVRESTALALGEIGGEQVRSVLLIVLQDTTDNSGVRGAAASALGKPGGEEALAVLLAILGDKTQPEDVRSAAAYSLGDIGGEQALAALLALLHDKTESDNVLNSVVYALSDISGEQALAELLEIVRGKRNSDRTRKLAINALGQVGGETAVTEVVTIFKDKSESESVRVSAFHTFSNKIGESLGVAQIMALLLAVLQDKTDSDNVRRSIVFMLRDSDREELPAPLLEILQDKTDSDNVRWSIGAHRKFPEQVLSKLLMILHDRTDSTMGRSAAARALGKIGGEQALATLLAFLHDKEESHQVRAEATYTLSIIGGEQALAALLTLLHDKEETSEIRGAAAAGFNKIGGKQVLETLLAIFHDEEESHEVRGEVAYTLGEIDEEQALETLLAILRDKTYHKYIRRAATAALEKIRAESVVNALVDVLSDTTKTDNPYSLEERICDVAARSLKRINTPASLAAVAAWEAAQPPKDEGDEQ